MKNGNRNKSLLSRPLFSSFFFCKIDVALSFVFVKYYSIINYYVQNIYLTNYRQLYN